MTITDPLKNQWVITDGISLLERRDGFGSGNFVYDAIDLLSSWTAPEIKNKFFFETKKEACAFLSGEQAFADGANQFMWDASVEKASEIYETHYKFDLRDKKPVLLFCFRRTGVEDDSGVLKNTHTLKQAMKFAKDNLQRSIKECTKDEVKELRYLQREIKNLTKDINQGVKTIRSDRAYMEAQLQLLKEWKP